MWESVWLCLTTESTAKNSYWWETSQMSAMWESLYLWSTSSLTSVVSVHTGKKSSKRKECGKPCVVAQNSLDIREITLVRYPIHARKVKRPLFEGRNLLTFFLFLTWKYSLFYFLIFIVIQLQLFAFSPHPSTPPQPNPPSSPTFTLPLDFVHVFFIVAPVTPSPHCPLPTPLWLLLDCS